MEKFARWKDHNIPGARATFICHRVLRAGRQGQGRDLGGYSYWPDLPKSVRASKRITAGIEKAAIAQGFTILKEK